MQAGREESRFKEGEKGQAPNNLFWDHPNWAKAAHLAPLLCKMCILAGSLSVPITPPDQNSRLIFKKAGTCSPLRPGDVCLRQQPAIVGWINTQRAQQAKCTDIFQQTSMLKCGYFTSKACIKKNLSIKQWLAQDIQALALPGRPRANCSSQENWVGSLGDWARMRTSVICRNTTHLLTVYNGLSCWRIQYIIYASLKANISYIPCRHLKAEMNCRWTWTLASINLAY